MAIEPMYPDNDYRLGVGPLKAKDVLSGVPGLLSGLTTLEVFVSAAQDQSATAVHSSLSKTLVEYGTTAKYATKFDGADITAHLTPGQTYYFIVRNGSQARAAGSVRCVDPRVAT